MVGMADDLTPHGAILEAARGGMSKREAARRAGISEGRWRQIVSGVQKVGGGMTIPANPKPETLIAMAGAVAADVGQVLRAAGLDPSLAGRSVTVGQPMSRTDSYARHASRASVLAASSSEDLWRQWADLYVESLAIEMEYGQRRGLEPAAARDELRQVLVMSAQMKDGRPWTPPWGDYPPGVTPWDEVWFFSPEGVAWRAQRERDLLARFQRDPNERTQDDVEFDTTASTRAGGSPAPDMSQADVTLAAREVDDDDESEAQQQEP